MTTIPTMTALHAKPKSKRSEQRRLRKEESVITQRCWHGRRMKQRAISSEQLEEIIDFDIYLQFWAGMQDTGGLWEDVGKGMLKSLVFAFVVTWIAVWQGYDTEPTAEGIGLATTRTVVMSSVMVLAIDFILTLGMYGDFK